MIGSGGLRRAARARRRGRRAVARPRAARGDEPEGHAGTPGTRPWSGRRRRRSRASTGSSTWSASRSTSAGPTRRRSGSVESRETATHNLVAAIAAADPRPARAGQPVGGRLLRRPRRRDRRRVGAAGRPLRRPRSASPGRPRRARSRRPACGWSIMRTGLVLDQPRRAAQASCCCRSSSGSAARSPAATSTCPGSTSTTRSGCCSGRSTTRRSRASYNASAPEPVTNREFSKALGRALGRPAVMPVPKLALSAVVGSELAEHDRGRPARRSRGARPTSATTFRYPKLEPALRAALA